MLGLGVLAFAVLQPVTVLPRRGLAPGFNLRDQSGAPFTSESTRGSITIYSFLPLTCDDACRTSVQTVHDVIERAPADVDLGTVTLEFVTIVLADDPASDEIAAAAERAGADGTTWRWVSGTEQQLRTVVGSGFRRSIGELDATGTGADGGFVIVDGWGVVRGDYRYATLQNDTEKLLDHLGLLGDELRHPGGFSGFAYRAAHAFSCYP